MPTITHCSDIATKVQNDTKLKEGKGFVELFFKRAPSPLQR